MMLYFEYKMISTLFFCFALALPLFAFSSNSHADVMHDQLLLGTYASVAEIDQARDRYLSGINEDCSKRSLSDERCAALRDGVKARYAQDRARYLELTNEHK